MYKRVRARPSLVMTFHSKERIKEYGINEEWVSELWQKANRITLPAKILNKKDHKYGNSQDTISYFSRCGYLLTVDQKDYKNPILITITKRYSGPMKIK